MARLGRLAALRLTFVGLGVLLLAPLVVAERVVAARTVEQTRLVHQMVSERIFDELERELTRILERESARPSSAYDLPTDSALWAPFVVGYFTRDTRGRRLVTRSSLPAAKHQELDERIERLNRSPPAETPQPTDTSIGAATPDAGTPSELPRSSPAVLRQLNVGRERRPLVPSKSKQEKRDPLLDYGY